jgi:hypothetical protein
MTGGQQMLMAGAGTFVSGTPWDVSATAATGVTTQSRLIFNTDGTITKLVTGTSTGADGSSNWWIPTTAGVGSGFFARFTATAGAWTDSTGASVASGVWKAFSGALLFVGMASTTSGSNSCTFDVDIATDSGGVNIVFRSVGNKVRFNHT